MYVSLVRVPSGRARASRRRDVAGWRLRFIDKRQPAAASTKLSSSSLIILTSVVYYTLTFLTTPLARVFNAYKKREAVRMVRNLRCRGKRLVLNFRCGLSNYKYHGAVACVNGKKKDEIDAGRVTGFGFALCV